MSQTRKPRGVRATEEGLQKLQQAKAAKRNDKGKPWTYFDVATAAEVDEKTVQRFFRGEAKDRNYAIAIVQALGLDITEVVDPKEWNPPEQAAEAIDWREVCGKVLAQQREKQNFRRSITGRHLGHEAKNVYVKLGLVKPKEQPRRGDEFQPSADRGMLQYQLTEQEIEQEYQYDEFLEQVIEGKEKNLTIVGEPGAGKSTWLEQIAFYVDNSNKGFPICISLLSLGGKSLEEYLFQIWLKKALLISQCDVGITSAQKKLEELFKSGKVWLLLDGVDEMRADESPLQAIATQLEGWGDLARVVLTCRSNVWEANPNALLNFETYRTLHFDDEQVGDFIQQWFTQEGKPKLGEELETKLDEARNDRIRDLIKNPLRLAMLCGIWYFHQGDLPKTKATLYQQYIEYFYRWKQHSQLAHDLDKQEELHAAFSKLALEAIDKKLPLRKKFVHKVMGKSLFQLARDVGWLNWVYKDAETGEDVYAFFHLTFQEYFAACAIDDWQFFLNHDNQNPNPLLNPNPSLEYDNGKPAYRIFEPQWKEVILLWLGRPKEEVSDDQKDEFIKNLVEFEDGTGYQFYWYRAFFMAITGLGEFINYSGRDKILDKCVKLSLGQFDEEIQRCLELPLTKQAKTVLKEIDPEPVAIHLIKAIATYQDKEIIREAIEYFTEISFTKEVIVEELISLLASLAVISFQNRLILDAILQGLGKVGTGNQRAIEALLEILYCTNKVESDIENLRSTKAFYHPGKLHPVLDIIYYIRGSALDSFGKIAAGDQMGINRLKEVLDSMRYQASRIEAASILWKINPGDSMTITVLREILLNTDNKFIFDKAIWILENLTTGEQRAIDTLLEIYSYTQDEDTRRIVCESLGKIGTGNQTAIDGLKEILRTNQNDETRKEAAESLGIIDPGNTTAIEALEALLLEPTTNQRILLLAATSLEKINHGNPIAFEKLRKLCTSKNEDFRLEASESLWKINPENPIVIKIVIETLIQIAFINPEDEDNEIEACKTLGELAKSSKIIVNKLINFMHTQSESDIIHRATIAEILGKTDSGKQTAIKELTRILNFSQDDNICWAVAECLGEISPNCSTAISVLIKLLNSSNTSYYRKQQIIQKLGEIGLDNEAAIKEFLKILCGSQDDVLGGFAAEGLKKIRQHKFMVMTVTSLKKNLEDEFDERDCCLDKERCEVLFHCAQNMPYPDFYQAWHQPTIQ